MPSRPNPITPRTSIATVTMTVNTGRLIAMAERFMARSRRGRGIGLLNARFWQQER